MRLDFMLVVFLIILLFWQNNTKKEEIFESKKQEIKIQKALPIDVAFEQTKAGEYLNDIREAMGMNTLLHNSLLENASQAHADYLVEHHSSSHHEIEENRGFTGINPIDRTLYAGYESMSVSENISTNIRKGKDSIDGLFSAIYHRFGFLDTGIDEIGIGVTQNSEKPEDTAFVYLMGNSELTALCHQKSFTGVGKYYYKICQDLEHRSSKKNFDKAKTYRQKTNPKIILYPYENQEEVPPAFYVETPDPLPDYDVSGFPVSISFNPYYFDKVELLYFRLYDAEDREIENVRIMDKDNDPHARFSDKEFALFPLERLDYESHYTAEVSYKHKGQAHTLSWQFTTKIPKEKLLVIQEKKAKIHIELNESVLLYFKPLHPHDVLESIYFPADISLERLDNNTFKLTMNKDLGDFEIKSGDRVVLVEVL
ncbi:putative periplasmic protein [hydrothermal vent metagenome]|uniref:Putative periplasmic protein n=1 Tax=hydrothermal vent metagenome TaxID=652676 RepID=A0A1W1CYZ9_9ZZZZ